MNKMFVIAGTYDQFKFFCNQLADSMNKEGITVRRLDIVYVSSIDQLRGYRDPWGYKVGTWADRSDINQIAQQIAIAGSSFYDDFIEVDL